MQAHALGVAHGRMVPSGACMRAAPVHCTTLGSPCGTFSALRPSPQPAHPSQSTLQPAPPCAARRSCETCPSPPHPPPGVQRWPGSPPPCAAGGRAGGHAARGGAGRQAFAGAGSRVAGPPRDSRKVRPHRARPSRRSASSRVPRARMPSMMQSWNRSAAGARAGRRHALSQPGSPQRPCDTQLGHGPPSCCGRDDSNNGSAGCRAAAGRWRGTCHRPHRWGSWGTIQAAAWAGAWASPLPPPGPGCRPADGQAGSQAGAHSWPCAGCTSAAPTHHSAAQHSVCGFQSWQRHLTSRALTRTPAARCTAQRSPAEHASSSGASFSLQGAQGGCRARGGVYVPAARSKRAACRRAAQGGWRVGRRQRRPHVALSRCLASFSFPFPSFHFSTASCLPLASCGGMCCQPASRFSAAQSRSARSRGGGGMSSRRHAAPALPPAAAAAKTSPGIDLQPTTAAPCAGGLPAAAARGPAASACAPPPAPCAAARPCWATRGQAGCKSGGEWEQCAHVRSRRTAQTGSADCGRPSAALTG